MFCHLLMCRKEKPACVFLSCDGGGSTHSSILRAFHAIFVLWSGRYRQYIHFFMRCRKVILDFGPSRARARYLPDVLGDPPDFTPTSFLQLISREGLARWCPPRPRCSFATSRPASGGSLRTNNLKELQVPGEGWPPRAVLGAAARQLR